jgi:hypothetical protein
MPSGLKRSSRVGSHASEGRWLSSVESMCLPSAGHLWGRFLSTFGNEIAVDNLDIARHGIISLRKLLKIKEVVAQDRLFLETVCFRVGS